MPASRQHHHPPCNHLKQNPFFRRKSLMTSRHDVLLEKLAFSLANEHSAVVARVEEWLGDSRQFTRDEDPSKEARIYQSLFRQVLRFRYRTYFKREQGSHAKREKTSMDDLLCLPTASSGAGRGGRRGSLRTGSCSSESRLRGRTRFDASCGL